MRRYDPRLRKVGRICPNDRRAGLFDSNRGLVAFLGFLFRLVPTGMVVLRVFLGHSAIREGEAQRVRIRVENDEEEVPHDDRERRQPRFVEVDGFCRCRHDPRRGPSHGFGREPQDDTRDRHQGRAPTRAPKYSAFSAYPNRANRAGLFVTPRWNPTFEASSDTSLGRGAMSRMNLCPCLYSAIHTMWARTTEDRITPATLCIVAPRGSARQERNPAAHPPGTRVSQGESGDHQHDEGHGERRVQHDLDRVGERRRPRDVPGAGPVDQVPVEIRRVVDRHAPDHHDDQPDVDPCDDPRPYVGGDGRRYVVVALRELLVRSRVALLAGRDDVLVAHRRRRDRRAGGPSAQYGSSHTRLRVRDPEK